MLKMGSDSTDPLIMLPGVNASCCMFGVTLLGHSPFRMEIGLIYLPGPFLFLACIGVCNHTFVVIVTFL